MNFPIEKNISESNKFPNRKKIIQNREKNFEFFCHRIEKKKKLE